MRLMITTLALSAALIGSPGAGGAAARQTRSPNACTVLKAALVSEYGGAVKELRFYPTRGALGQVFNCSAKKGPFVDPWEHVNFTFGFLPPAAWGSAAAAHRFWQATWNKWRGKTGKDLAVERLRGFGADDAFAVVTRYQDPKPHYNADVYWVKGGYEGELEFWSPGHSPSGALLPGLLLKALMKGIPRS
jgi:hypothetical protein